MEELARDFFEQGVNSRKDFDAVDSEINGSIKKITEAFANLAEQKPEEVFGLKPTERDKFFAEKLLSREVLNAATSGAGGDDDSTAGGDTTGSNPLATAAIAEALIKAVSSEGGAKIVEELLNHIRAEKDFFKETGKEMWDGVKKVLD